MAPRDQATDFHGRVATLASTVAAETAELAKLRDLLSQYASLEHMERSLRIHANQEGAAGVGR